MTTNINDKKIFALKKQIEDKKKALAATERFSPVTNCTLPFDGKRINLHVLGVDDVQDLLVRLNMYRMSAEDLGIAADYKLGQSTIADWIKDLKARLMHINRKVEEQRLAVMEAKLHNLLSADTKVGLEIDDIAGSLGIDLAGEEKQ